METDLHPFDGGTPDVLTRIALRLRRPLLDAAVLALALGVWAALVAVVARAFSDGRVPGLTTSGLEVAASLVGLAAASALAHVGTRLVLRAPAPAGTREFAAAATPAIGEPQVSRV
jgi:hypothetical protein